MTYSDCPEAAQLAADVIERWYPHLQDADIRYFLTDRSKSKVVLCSPILRFLTEQSADAEDDEDGTEGSDGADWFVYLEEDEWAGLTEPGREALLDELLAQCGQDKDDKTEAKRWKRIRGVTVWPQVLERRGFWRAEQKPIKDAAAKQLQLGLDLDQAIEAATATA